MVFLRISTDIFRKKTVADPKKIQRKSVNDSEKIRRRIGEKQIK